MSHRERRQTGTTIIGMIYDKGALILADTQTTAGVRPERGAVKIYPVENNILVGQCGHLARCQKLVNTYKEELREFRTAMEEDLSAEYKEKIKRYSKERKQKAIRKFNKLSKHEKLLKLYSEEFMILDTKDGMEITALPRDSHGNLEYHTSAIAYNKVGKEILIEVSTAAEFFRQMMGREHKKNENADDEDVDFLVAGFDNKGPRLYEVSFDEAIIDTTRGYMTLGSGSLMARPRLREYYRENLSLEQALQVITYAGIKASEDDIMTNRIFRIGAIEKVGNKVKSRMVEQDLVDKITEEMRKVRVQFPYKKF
jgi:20S proteasome alpha/beta subunit